MADITMCNGIGCDKKRECYRFTAKPNEFRQAYFNIAPWYHNVAPWYQSEHRDKQACKFYWPINSDPVAAAQSE